MDNKKSGIRLRHLQQHYDNEPKRDLSPGIHRRKIFQKNQNRVAQNKVNRIQSNGNPFGLSNQKALQIEYEQLIQNLKKKTMQVQLRDQTIRYLNKQLDDLKKQIMLKDKQIGKITSEIQRLKKQATYQQEKMNRNSYQSFKNVDQTNFNRKRETEFDHNHHYAKQYHEPNKNRNSVEVKDRTNSFKHLGLSQQISLTNLNVYPIHNNNKTYNNMYELKPQLEIVSPFMALTNDKQNSNPLSNQITIKNINEPLFMEQKKQTKNNKISNPFQQKDISSMPFQKKTKITNPYQQRNVKIGSKPLQSKIGINHALPNKSDRDFSGFYNNNNSEFDFKVQQFQPPNQQNIVSSVDKQLQKFNIFRQQSQLNNIKNNKNKAEIYQRSNLQIENSRQFKFQEFEPIIHGESKFGNY